jgi:hypothetical protein
MFPASLTPLVVAKLYPTNVICVCDTPLATYPAAFAVRRGNLEFVNFLNSWIEAHTADQWFGTAAGLLVQDDGLGERSLIGTNLGRTSLGYLISDFTRTYGGKWFRSLW